MKASSTPSEGGRATTRATNPRLALMGRADITSSRVRKYRKKVRNDMPAASAISSTVTLSGPLAAMSSSAARSIWRDTRSCRRAQPSVRGASAPSFLVAMASILSQVPATIEPKVPRLLHGPMSGAQRSSFIYCSHEDPWHQDLFSVGFTDRRLDAASPAVDCPIAESPLRQRGPPMPRSATAAAGPIHGVNVPVEEVPAIAPWPGGRS
jgi:hypothetical protein